MIRKTKIIATIGPATSSKEKLKSLIQKGVNVCRLNFSHLSYEDAKEVISNIKEINQELNIHTAILADLQGPKIRLGDFEKPIKLKKGIKIVFCTKKKKDTIYINYNNFAKDVKPKDRVLLYDGKLGLEVVSTNNRDVVVLRVVFEGLLQSRKGVNLPNTTISLPCLTKKDMKEAIPKSLEMQFGSANPQEKKFQAFWLEHFFSPRRLVPYLTHFGQIKNRVAFRIPVLEIVKPEQHP